MTEPRTEAGQRLLDSMAEPWDVPERAAVTEAILAVEAEAAALALAELRAEMPDDERFARMGADLAS